MMSASSPTAASSGRSRRWPHRSRCGEFVALANHRKVIKAEIAASSRKFRQLQLDALAKVLDGYGVDPETRSPEVVMLLMSSVSRFLRIEESFDVDTGHRAMIAVVENFLRELEGDRRDDAAPVADRHSAPISRNGSAE